MADSEKTLADLNAEVANRFEYHPPSTPGSTKAHSYIRAVASDFAADILEYVPEGREQALALTKLEEATFWANAGIARN